MNTTASIRGLGFYAPERIVTNADLERLVETNDEWITSRTGIKQRHMAAPGQANTDLALEAARQALADASMEPEELTHILYATVTPDYVMPASAYILQDKLGIKGRMGFDFATACSGYLYGLELARAIIALHPGAKVLVAASEVLSSRMNWQDRTTCVLFGDGAGAMVLSGPLDASAPAPKGRLLDVIVGSDGSLGHLLTIKGGGCLHPPVLGQPVDEEFFIQMHGREVFKHAVRAMEHVSKDLLARHGLAAADLALVIPHQANIRIIDAVAERLELSEAQVFKNLSRYGNTSAASIAIALAEAKEQGVLDRGGKVLLTAFGGGFSWGAALLDFPPHSARP